MGSNHQPGKEVFISIPAVKKITFYTHFFSYLHFRLAEDGLGGGVAVSWTALEAVALPLGVGGVAGNFTGSGTGLIFRGNSLERIM